MQWLETLRLRAVLWRKEDSHLLIGGDDDKAESNRVDFLPFGIP